MLWVKLTIDKLDNPARGDHKLRPKGQSHRLETSQQNFNQPSAVLPVKHTSLTARTNDKPHHSVQVMVMILKILT